MTFEELINGFENIFSTFNPTSNCFKIGGYFGPGMGQVTAKKKLIEDNRIEPTWLKGKNDFKK